MSRKILSTIIVLAMIFTLLSGAISVNRVKAASTWYVDGAFGTDDGTHGTGPGSNAFKTIQYAINDSRVTAGDTINVAAGTYHENLASWKDMEITKSLSLIGAGSGSTIIELSEGKSLGGKTNGIEIRGSGLNVLLQGLTFTRKPGNTYATSFPIRVAETTSTFTKLSFIDIEVAYAEGPNVNLGGAGTYAEVYIEDCYFHHGGTWGFVGSGTINKITVIDSRFEDNGQKDPGHGIGFDLTGTSSKNILIDGGNFSNNKHTGINLMRVSDAIFRNFVANNNGGHPGGGFGVKLDEWGGKSQNILFENFTASGNTLDGVSIQPEKEDAIENVTIRGATLTGNLRNGVILCYIYNGSNNPQMKNITIEYSNLYGNGAYGVQVSSWWVPMTITEVFDATKNWWGDESGPSGVGSGTGDAVSANVDYSPWLIPNISVTKSDSPDPVAQGMPLTYTLNWIMGSTWATWDGTTIGNITVNIPSGLTFDNVLLEDTLSPEVTYVSCTDGGTHSLGVITWNLGTYIPGKTGSITVNVNVNLDTPDGAITNNIEIIYDSLKLLDTETTLVKKGAQSVYSFYDSRSNAYVMINLSTPRWRVAIPSKRYDTGWMSFRRYTRTNNHFWGEYADTRYHFIIDFYSSGRYHIIFDDRVTRISIKIAN